MRQWHDTAWAVAVLLGALGLQVLFTSHTRSYAPAILTLSIVIAWVARAPWMWLLGGALVAELFSTLPAGIMAIVFVLPLAIQWVAQPVAIDASWQFLAAVSAAASLQVAVIFLPDALALRTAFLVPWLSVAATVAMITLSATMACLGRSWLVGPRA